MKNHGFTLIEVIVTMAILSIMVGVLTPMMYRVWESTEISTTRERMVDLKKAIAGAPEIYQQGVRSHYGFVGDIGVLPNNLDDLITDSGTWGGWRGPYLAGGFNSATFKLDAWSNPIQYLAHSPALIVTGESIVATLRSAGPDQIFGNADDINENTDLELQILSSDVFPTADMQGNLNATFTATTTAAPTYYAHLLVNFRNGSGWAATTSGCLPLVIGTVEAGVPKTITQAYNLSFPITLPVGKSTLKTRLFSDSGCTALVEETGEMAIFVNDGLNEISVNPPTLYYRIN